MPDHVRNDVQLYDRKADNMSQCIAWTEKLITVTGDVLLHGHSGCYHVSDYVHYLGYNS